MSVVKTEDVATKLRKGAPGGEEQLVAATRAGDDAGFEAIYERHHRGILSFCRHMLGSRQEAEDAVQQTFLNAYRGMLASEAWIEARPWLYRIARNHCISVLRRRREEPADEVEVSSEGLAAQVERREDLREMLADLAALPYDQREALLLSELGTVSHDEIAGILGRETKQVKALVFRARKSLAESRDARNASCRSIREQLSVLRGGSLRRNAIRRHLRHCEGCRAFRDEVRSQRAALAMILPVAPSAGLKALSLPANAAAAGLASATGGAAGAGLGPAASGLASGAAAGGLATAAGSGGLASKAATLLAIGALGGGVIAADQAGLVPPATNEQGTIGTEKRDPTQRGGGVSKPNSAGHVGSQRRGASSGSGGGHASGRAHGGRRSSGPRPGGKHGRRGQPIDRSSGPGAGGRPRHPHGRPGPGKGAEGPDMRPRQESSGPRRSGGDTSGSGTSGESTSGSPGPSGELRGSGSLDGHRRGPGLLEKLPR